MQSLHSSSCIVVACCICGIVRLICKQIMSYCLYDKAGYIFISAKDSFCTLVTVDMMLIIVNLVAVRVSQKGHFVQSCLISCSLCRTVNSFMMLCIWSHVFLHCAVVHETLENRGILGQLRARIRAEVFSALNDPTDSRPEVSRENFLINELIREYLDFNHYKYASSVLAAGLYFTSCTIPCFINC